MRPAGQKAGGVAIVQARPEHNLPITSEFGGKTLDGAQKCAPAVCVCARWRRRVSGRRDGVRGRQVARTAALRNSTSPTRRSRASMVEASERPLSCAGVTADVTVLLCVPRRVQERLQELHRGQVVHGVRFLLHDPDPEVEEEPPLPACDLVVHKAVNDLALLRDGDAAAAARYATLQKLAARGVPMLDPLESMPLFADRAALCRALEAAGPSVRQPRYLEVCASDGGVSVLEAARAAGLRLPLLCKPLLACGPPASNPT